MYRFMKCFELTAFKRYLLEMAFASSHVLVTLHIMTLILYKLYYYVPESSHTHTHAHETVCMAPDSIGCVRAPAAQSPANGDITRAAEWKLKQTISGQKTLNSLSPHPPNTHKHTHKQYRTPAEMPPCRHNTSPAPSHI